MASSFKEDVYFQSKDPCPPEQRRQLTIISLVEHFMKAYALEGSPISFIHHDAIHAMTGLNIGVADELRVAACELALLKGSYWTHRYRDARHREEELYPLLTTDTSLNVAPAGLMTEAARKVQFQSLRLDPKEVEEQFALGKKMYEAIKRLTGKAYHELTEQQIAQLNFEDVNFVTEAQTIKAKYERPKNKKIESKTAALFRKEAARKGIDSESIPDAGMPWHNNAVAAIQAPAPAMASQ